MRLQDLYDSFFSLNSWKFLLSYFDKTKHLHGLHEAWITKVILGAWESAKDFKNFVPCRPISSGMKPGKYPPVPDLSVPVRSGPLVSVSRPVLSLPLRSCIYVDISSLISVHSQARCQIYNLRIPRSVAVFVITWINTWVLGIESK